MAERPEEAPRAGSAAEGDGMAKGEVRGAVAEARPLQKAVARACAQGEQVG